MVMLTNYVIARAGFTLRGPGRLALCRDFCNIFLPNTGEDQKKVLLSEHGVPEIVPYGISDPGYWIAIIKRLDEGL